MKNESLIYIIVSLYFGELGCFCDNGIKLYLKNLLKTMNGNVIICIMFNNRTVYYCEEIFGLLSDYSWY